MKYFCTVSDYGYLIKGLVLYDSLKEQSSEEFILYYFCLDEKSFNKLKELNYKSLIPIKLEDTMSSQFSDRKTRLLYKEFCWACASYISLYCLHQLKLDHILYIDSDIMFFNDPSIIFKEIENKDIGIILHRHVPIGHRVGAYNVGIVYFKNSDIGKKCCSFWFDCASDKSNRFYTSHGQCGDQKYLELFIPLFNEEHVCVIDKLTGHGAPFNFELYQYDDFENNKTIIYKNTKQPIVFVHFMQFYPNFENNTYKPTGEPDNQNFMKIPEVRKLYNLYFERSKKYEFLR